MFIHILTEFVVFSLAIFSNLIKNKWMCMDVYVQQGEREDEYVYAKEGNSF